MGCRERGAAGCVCRAEAAQAQSSQSPGDIKGFSSIGEGGPVFQGKSPSETEGLGLGGEGKEEGRTVEWWKKNSPVSEAGPMMWDG